MFTLFTYILIVAIGFMMGVLYKRTTTSVGLLNPDPSKTLKLYIGVLITALLVTFGISWYTTHALHRAQLPEEGQIVYNNTHSILIFTLNFFFFALVVLSNAYSQAVKHLAWGAYVLTFGYYAVFILKDAYVITDYYILWQRSMQLIRNDIPDFTQTAWAKCLLGFIVTAFNAGMIAWGLRK